MPENRLDLESAPTIYHERDDPGGDTSLLGERPGSTYYTSRSANPMRKIRMGDCYRVDRSGNSGWGVARTSTRDSGVLAFSDACHPPRSCTELRKPDDGIIVPSLAFRRTIPPTIVIREILVWYLTSEDLSSARSVSTYMALDRRRVCEALCLWRLVRYNYNQSNKWTSPEQTSTSLREHSERDAECGDIVLTKCHLQAFKGGES